MTVSKELLQDLNIFSMTIEAKEQSISCILRKYERGLLQFNLLENIEKIFSDDVSLIICIQEADDCFNSESAKLHIVDSGTDFLNAKTEGILSETIKRLIDQLAFLENQEEKYGRRKEPRIKIGKNNYKNFGLSSAEQKIFSKTAKIIQPCALLDVSVHGICIITPFENPAFKNIENFHLQLSFSNPEQTVILQCHKVHTRLNDTGNRIFSTLSCQLLEPIHYVWKERVLRMIEYEESGKSAD